MILKTISKEMLAEGLSLDLINNINMVSNYTPVILLPGDEPSKLLQCSSGYWVVQDDGGILRDKKGYYVVPEKDAQIGRARYLLTYGKSEKKAKIDNLCSDWKNQCRNKLDHVAKTIDFEQKYLKGEFTSLEHTLRKIADQENLFPKSGHKIDLPKLISEYNTAEEMYLNGDFVSLLKHLGIKQFSNPMLSVKHDDEKGMAVLKNTFGRAAIDEWDGDMLNRYAAIEIEKQYPYLVF